MMGNRRKDLFLNHNTRDFEVSLDLAFLICTVYVLQ